MLSRILLNVASTRYRYLLLSYLCVLVLVTGLGAIALRIAEVLQPLSLAERRRAPELLIESAANTLGLSSIDVSGHAQLSAWIALSQDFVGILVNGVFVAMVVLRTVRVNHRALVFANHVLLPQQPDGTWRLEFRICNNSRFDMTNVVIRIQYVEYLQSFPKTTAHRTRKLELNYDEYLILAAHGYMLVSSGPNPISTNGSTAAQVDESLLSRHLFFRVLIRGQYVESGLGFSQFHVYDGSSVHKGHWRYYLKEDLVRRGRLRLEEFSAFDAEQNHKLLPP